MGCAFSKGDGGGDDVVSLCKERKWLMKMAVKQRQEFADSYSKYIDSLSSVSSAIRLLVASYTNPSPLPHPPPLNFDYPPSPTNQTDLANSALEPISPFQPTAPIKGSETEITGRESGEQADEEEDGGVGVCEFFYGDKPPPPMPSPERGVEWDFFNLFNGSSLEALCLMREKDEEGLSGDEGEKRKSILVRKGDESGGIGNHEVKGVDEDGSTLLDAMKDVEDHFVRAYESGLNVSKMLEANNVQHTPSCFEDIKENSNDFVNSILWHRFISSQSSPCKSLLSDSTNTSSTWTECRSDPFDGRCSTGMQAGSHALTLGRLYAWETKLFEEVKAGDKHKKSYQKKCELLKMHIEGEDKVNASKARAEITALYTKALVARRSAASIYKQIEKLRDEELQPQILELIDVLMSTWKIMLESHEIQAKTICQVKSFSSDVCGKTCNDSLRLATLDLEATLQNWHACFFQYMSSQKAYIKTLCDWLSKFVDVSEFNSTGKPVIHQMGSKTLPATCHKWLETLETLPQNAVKKAIKSLAKDVRTLWVQQGEEQHQKRKVDDIAKEIDRRALTLQKQEQKFAATKNISPIAVKDQVGYLSEKKDLMDQLRKKLDLEKVKYHDSMVETSLVALNGLAKGFCCVFESLVDFSKDAVKLYADLLALYENISEDDDRDRDHELLSTSAD